MNEEAPMIAIAPHAEKAVKASGRRIHLERFLEKLCMGDRLVKESTYRLATLIGSEIHYPVTGRPVLDHCLEAAIEAGVMRHHRFDAQAFVDALLNRAEMLLEVTCRSRQGMAWDPLSDEPFTVWRRRVGVVDVHLIEEGDAHEYAPAAFRRRLEVHLGLQSQPAAAQVQPEALIA